MKKKYLMLIAVLIIGSAAFDQQPVNIAESVRGYASESGWVASVLHWYDEHMNYYAVG